MKKIKRILYFLLGLFFTGFVAICAFNPDITESIAEILYPDPETDSNQVVSGEMNPDMLETDSDENTHQDMEPSEWEPFDRYPDEGLFEEDAEESGYEGVEAGITSDYIPSEQSAIIIPESV